MICTKKDHQGGENCVTCTEHAFLKQLGERRKERGIRLSQFKIMVEANAAASLIEFWNGWIELLDKERATDYLLLCMRRGDEALRSAMQKKQEVPKRTQGRATFEKVSAPRLED